MEVLNDFKAKYACRLLAESIHTNVYSALLEAERVEKGELKQIFTDIDDFYLLHDESWASPYIVKKSKNYGQINYNNDENLKRFRW